MEQKDCGCCLAWVQVCYILTNRYLCVDANKCVYSLSAVYPPSLSLSNDARSAITTIKSVLTEIADRDSSECRLLYSIMSTIYITIILAFIHLISSGLLHKDNIYRWLFQLTVLDVCQQFVVAMRRMNCEHVPTLMVHVDIIMANGW